MNNEVIDYFRHLSDIYIRTADFVIFLSYISEVPCIAIPFTILYSQLKITNLESSWDSCVSNADVLFFVSHGQIYMIKNWYSYH